MKKIETDHFKHYKYPTKLEISESGAIACTVASVDCEDNRYPVNLYVDETPVLEDAEINSFFWQKGALIINALKEKKSKTSVVSVYEPTSKKLTELFCLDKKIQYLAPLTGGRWLLLCRDDLSENPDDDYIIADEYPFRTDEDGYINKIRGRLYLYEDGKPALLTPETLNIGRLKAFGGEYAAFTAAEYTHFWNGDEKLYYVDLKTLEISVFDDKDYMYGDLCPEKGHIVAIRSDKAVYGESQPEYIDRISLSDKSLSRLNEDCEIYVRNNIYASLSFGMDGKRYIPAGSGVYFIATIKDRSYICFGDFETGGIEPVSDGKMVIEDFRIKDGDIYMLAMEQFRGPEIYVKSEGGTKRVTSFNSHLWDVFSVSAPSGFTFTSKDGKAEVYGYEMKPTGVAEGEKYPAILFIHGGPDMAYSDCFYLDFQILANNGYGVLFCNPRGSVGHGAEFADLRGKYYTVDYDDIMQFLDIALSRNPMIDGNRLGVTGGSYGAMMTNWAITHSNRFKAAVSDRGVALEMQDYFMSDIGFAYGPDVYGKTAWDEGGAEVMWENSSVKYAPAVKTPTLFLHATDDFRCSKEQSILMFSALKYFGVDSRLVLIKDENHEFAFCGKPKNRIRRYEEILNWFNNKI